MNKSLSVILLIVTLMMGLPCHGIAQSREHGKLLSMPAEQ